MTKIDIVSGFLGAGKTTLIKKLLAEAYKGEKLVLIENEFGEINIDGGFLKEPLPRWWWDCALRSAARLPWNHRWNGFQNPECSSRAHIPYHNHPESSHGH